MKLLLALVALSIGAATAAQAQTCPAGAVDKANAVRSAVQKASDPAQMTALDALAKASPNCGGVAEARGEALVFEARRSKDEPTARPTLVKAAADLEVAARNGVTPDPTALALARTAKFTDDIESGRLKVAVDAYNAKQGQDQMYAIFAVTNALQPAASKSIISNGYQPFKDKIAALFNEVKKLPEAEQPKARELLFDGACASSQRSTEPAFLYSWLVPNKTCATGSPAPRRTGVDP